jgi:hypothetical protein
MWSYVTDAWLGDPYGTFVIVAGLLSPVVAIAVPAVLAWLIFWPKRAASRTSGARQDIESGPPAVPEPPGESNRVAA